MAEHETKDAIDLLMEDHRAVEGLFARFESAEGGEAKVALARRICLELKVHTLVEEEIFYPSVRGLVDDDLLDEAHVEHDAAEVLINEIEAAWADEAFYTAKVKVLKAAVEHHVEEEEDERQGLFVQTRKAGVDLRGMGVEIAARRAELKQDGEEGRLPPAETRTFLGVQASLAGPGEAAPATAPERPHAGPGAR